MKQVFIGLLAVIATKSFATISNNTTSSSLPSNDSVFVVINSANNSGNTNTNCLFQTPKKYKRLPSPAFKQIQNQNALRMNT